MTEQELKLSVIETLEQATNIAPQSHDEDLFQSGLDSLLLVELLLSLEERFGVEVTLDNVDLEQFRTVNGIAAYVGKQSVHA